MKFKIGLLTAFIAICMILIPLWRWALYGMSEKVGTAWLLTDVFVLLIGGAVASILEEI